MIAAEEYIVTLGERQITVRVRPKGAAYEVTVDGRAYLVDSHRLPGSFVQHLLVGGRSHEANVRFEGDRASVYLGGIRIDLRVEEEIWARASRGRESRVKGGAEELLAPMPGTIVSVHATVGDLVEPGVRVVVVEAMKMQNELAAVSGGIVTAIRVKPGDTVDAGQVLISFRPAAEGKDGAA